MPLDKGYDVQKYLDLIMAAPLLANCGSECTVDSMTMRVSWKQAAQILNDECLDCYMTRRLDFVLADASDRCFAEAAANVPWWRKLFFAEKNYNDGTRFLASIERVVPGAIQVTEKKWPSQFGLYENTNAQLGAASCLFLSFTSILMLRVCQRLESFPVLQRVEKLLFAGYLPLDLKDVDGNENTIVYW